MFHVETIVCSWKNNENHDKLTRNFKKLVSLHEEVLLRKCHQTYNNDRGPIMAVLRRGQRQQVGTSFCRTISQWKDGSFFLLSLFSIRNLYGFINIYIFAELYIFSNKNSEFLINNTTNNGTTHTESHFQCRLSNQTKSNSDYNHTPPIDLAPDEIPFVVKSIKKA